MLKPLVKDNCYLQNIPHNLDNHFYEVPQEQNDFFSIGYGGVL